MFRLYLQLSKFKISILVLITAVLGYVLSYEQFSLNALIYLIVGVYLVSSGSFILNQLYEVSIDRLMDRTKKRPIPSGKISPSLANFLGYFLIIVGLCVLFLIGKLPPALALITCILYNFYYTLRWKKKFPFAAVFLGAIPGALPVVIGYSAGASSILSASCFYLFLIMFLWQMPHFWALAFRYKEDYKKASIPVLPLYIGDHKTFLHIGLYLLSYLGVALLSPFFLETSFVYMIVVIPIFVKLIIEFYLFYKHKKWLPFFIWLNLSLIFFLGIPLVDRWIVSMLIS